MWKSKEVSMEQRFNAVVGDEAIIQAGERPGRIQKEKYNSDIPRRRALPISSGDEFIGLEEGAIQGIRLPRTGKPAVIHGPGLRLRQLM